MSPEAFDAIVVGSGSGGMTVAIGLARFGKRVGLVERGPVGGDCTNTGCIPSKRLIHLARTDAAAGPAAVLADVRSMRDGLEAKERLDLEADPNITLIVGNGRLTSRSTVQIDGQRTLTAPHIVIATGSRARPLDIAGLPAERCFTNESLFELDDAPVHLAIVGAGAIGVEMAAAFRRLGSRVTLVELADRALPPAIPEASAVLDASLRRRGIDVRLGARVRSFDEPTRTLRLDAGDVENVDAVLVAVGRAPNVETLGLDAAGLVAGPAGISVDGWGRTAVKGIWAVGDVTPGSHQTHAANAMGRRIIQRIAIPWLPPIGGPPPIPTAVFSEPEVAWIGLTPEELARHCHPEAVVRVRVDLPDTDRGLTDGVTGGFVAIDAVRLTGRIMSATVVGPSASELIAPIALAMSRRLSLLRLSRMTWAYPTFSGAIGAAADEFARRTLPHLGRESMSYLRHRFRHGATEGAS